MIKVMADDLKALETVHARLRAALVDADRADGRLRDAREAVSRGEIELAEALKKLDAHRAEAEKLQWKMLDRRPPIVACPQCCSDVTAAAGTGSSTVEVADAAASPGGPRA